MNDLPRVSILTPTYDRKRFLPLMIENLKNMVYPKEKLEWIILDSWSRDGEVAERLFSDEDEIAHYRKVTGIYIKYIYKPEALSIGKKRNILVKESNYKYCINLDSDDIYFPHYILNSIRTLLDNKKECCGSAEMLFIFPKVDYKITGIRCQALRQIHEATMCHTKKHWKRMGGYAISSQGEGAAMIDGCNEKFFIKTEIHKCMMCVCHDDNTVSKDVFNKESLEVTDVETDIIPNIKILKDIF
tara:strand:+ start:844 stop:1575 length:732 start_codon:yes stop_codon:yes gene_type:complete